MTKLKSHSLDLGYPIYGAKFVNENTLIVAGGGGEGSNGIPNKITALLIQPDNLKKPIKRYRELTLNDKEDCPMTLDVNNNQILVGINENAESIKRGVNKHLRKFKFHNDHLKFVESCQIHPSNNAQHYQKLTQLTKDGTLAAIAMSDDPSSVYIVDTTDELEEKFKIVTTGDVKDISLSPDGKMMCYITSSHFEAISTITGRSVFKTKINFLMSKIEFYDNNIVIIAGSNKSGIVLGEFSVAKSAVTKVTVIARNLKGITSLDVNNKTGLIALSGSDCSILIVRFKDFKLLKKLDKVHGFAITKVTFSQAGDYLASVSAANTVNVILVPQNFADSKPLFMSFIQLFMSIILVSLFAVVGQYLYANGYLEQLQTKAVEYYKSKKPADSSAYFTIQPIASSEVFAKGPPSTTTYVPIHTADSTTKSISENTNVGDTSVLPDDGEYTTHKPLETSSSSGVEVSANSTSSAVTNRTKETETSLPESQSPTSSEVSSILTTNLTDFAAESPANTTSETTSYFTETLNHTATVVETIVETQTISTTSIETSTKVETILTTAVETKTEVVFVTMEPTPAASKVLEKETGQLQNSSTNGTLDSAFLTDETEKNLSEEEQRPVHSNTTLLETQLSETNVTTGDVSTSSTDIVETSVIETNLTETASSTTSSDKKTEDIKVETALLSNVSEPTNSTETANKTLEPEVSILETASSVQHGSNTTTTAETVSSGVTENESSIKLSTETSTLDDLGTTDSAKFKQSPDILPLDTNSSSSVDHTDTETLLSKASGGELDVKQVKETAAGSETHDEL
ncbi:hypothetical protein OGAPHI_000153 [Ogataea philodendri]|uniref:Guanine nucleotide-exchange factor SEC12 n=1 Tax=Ogataea philodendri TaxID=1378263 RepID=A0A9P8PIL8_9ASCO|nr:uncharacterized protein OGAPHI_000153 [Ogataea philodendri]KAH3671967.1 hypothetical protein OGAPHI_000153 [Ogataea philodendri]